MTTLSGRKILLVIGGGIAAYKALELVRLIAKAGGETRAVLTAAGAEFVTPLSLAALTGHPVRQSLFLPDDETAMGHIELSRWADLVVVAPATAGPIIRPTVTIVELRPIAFVRSSRPTRSRTIAWRAGFSTALTIPRRNAKRRT